MQQADLPCVTCFFCYSVRLHYWVGLKRLDADWHDATNGHVKNWAWSLGVPAQVGLGPASGQPLCCLLTARPPWIPSLHATKRAGRALLSAHAHMPQGARHALQVCLLVCATGAPGPQSLHCLAARPLTGCQGHHFRLGCHRLLIVALRHTTSPGAAPLREV